MSTKGHGIDLERAVSHTSWWKTAAIYQIYPASFRDANGDGSGDLPGIFEKLDYVKSIGVDAVWLSPFYKSPNYDMGYDISDYQQPDPSYGNLEDIQAIIDGCHERGLKCMFDLVINHTSHQHEWFRKSRESKDNEYRKYYHWKPPRYDENNNRIPPTNWRAAFGGSTWTFDDTTQEYYLHLFTPQQPDLNWETEEVRDAIFKEAVTYWLEKGVDGFRIDTANLYSKPDFVDVEVTDPHAYDQPAYEFWGAGNARLDEYLKEMNSKTFDKFGSATIAEIGPAPDLESMLRWVREDQRLFNMSILFNLVYLDHHAGGEHYLAYQKPDLLEIKKVIAKEQAMADVKHKGWLCNYLENHDQARSVSRYGNGDPTYYKATAKMLAIFLTTLSGTLLLYQGQEIGMINMPKEWELEEYIDPMSIGYYDKMKDMAKSKGEKEMKDVLPDIQMIARDHARTPMQWNRSKNGGFSDADKTWMRVNDSYKDINVDEQEMDANSVLNFWRSMLKHRAQYMDTFIFGLFELVDADNPNVISYLKRSQGDDGKHTIFVTLNWSAEEQEFEIPKESGLGENPEVLVSSLESNRPREERKLQPFEGRVYVNLEGK